jgi:hypothetical protein
LFHAAPAGVHAAIKPARLRLVINALRAAFIRFILKISTVMGLNLDSDRY